MPIYRHEIRREFRIAACLAAIWFTLFVVLAPIFHRHADEIGFGTPAISALVSAPESGVAPTPVFHKTSGLNPLNSDDCPLCQWFAVGFTPPCVFTLLTLSAALVQLLFDVRLSALCRRPLPQRGLRAPPLAAC